MRSESPEERGRQKVAEPPTYRIENEYNPEAIPQYFQISVGVLEGRNFTWLNPRLANSYVVIMLGNKKCRTSIRRNKQAPHYREYFSFGMYASMYDLQRSIVTFSVMEPRCCASPYLLGEVNIDLGTVWRQPYFPKTFPKWTQLSRPRDPTAGSMGFLKIDISITCRSCERILPPVARNNNVELNYLFASSSEQQNANFIVTIHGAFGLPNTSRHHSDKHHSAKPPNTFVRVLFCGLQAKTSIQKRTSNPMYNEQISMVELFPSSNLTFRFEICSMDTFASRLLASKSLNLDHVSHDGENGYLPTFGPSLLPMYGSSSVGNLTPSGDCPFYRGSLLISFNTVVPYYQQSLRSINVEPVVPISLDNVWTLKTFCIFCPIFEASMLDSKLVSDFCGIAITIGEIPTENNFNEDPAYITMNEVKSRKLHYTGSLDVMRSKSDFGFLDFSNTYPVLQSTAQLPDYRFRIYRNNAISRIVRTLKSILKKVERRLKYVEYTTPKDLLDELNKVLDDVASNILLYFNNNSSNTHGTIEREYETELDRKQFVFQTEEMKKIREKILEKYTLNTTESKGHVNLEVSRRTIKCLLAETHTITRDLEKLIFKATEGWPDLIIWLLNDGSRIGFCKISIADIIYSEKPEECGALCGRIKSAYFKPLKCSRHVNSLSMGCFCDVGKLEFLAWMGLHEQSSAFEPYLPSGYKLKIKNYEMCIKCNGIMVECRVFICKARLLNNNPDDFDHFYIRIHALNTSQDSKIIEPSPTLIWNQLVRFKKIVHTSLDRLLRYPPIVVVEMNRTNLSGKSELIGSFQMESEIEEREVLIPKLRWYEMYKGMENTGKVLISLQILPVIISMTAKVPETFLKSTIYTTVQECFLASDMKEFENTISNIDLLPADLIPQMATYKIDIYWWGLRNLNITKKPYVVLEIEDIVIKSEVISNKKDNCNFSNGRVSRVFEASFNERFCPSINVKLYDNCTFGRTLFIGTSIVKKPNKFFTYWYPKTEREASLKRASIMSADFVKVSQTLYFKKKISTIGDGEECRYNSDQSCISTNIPMKRSFLRRMFCKKEPQEEEYTLLPPNTGKCTNEIVKKSQTNEKKDWWSRYARSQNNYAYIEGESVIAGDKFIIYESELERQPQFLKFKDWYTSFKLYNSEKIGVRDKEEDLQCGYLKAGIVIYKWPPPANTVAVSSNGVDLNGGFFQDYASNESAKFLVRVYIIKGINLITKNISGKFHPFVIITCGSKRLGERSHVIPNTVNPIFGIENVNVMTIVFEGQKSSITIDFYYLLAIANPLDSEIAGKFCLDLQNELFCNTFVTEDKVYEFRCTLPDEYQLTVSLYNHDPIETDELIGNTSIDLENRIYTKHRACVGLASEYTMSEPGKWRDCSKPSVILEEMCERNHLPPPNFSSFSTVVINGVEYTDNDQDKGSASACERRENICLNILHNWNNLPVCGYPLVPEHIETRTLYHPDIPDVGQGKLQMWIDIFPIGSGSHIPPAVDITPRKTEEYELKLTIFKMKLFEKKFNDFTKKSNLFIRVWAGFIDEMQNTSCYSTSPDGYFDFNWCMTFCFNYDYAERKLVKKEKNQFTDFEENVNPELNIQIMDNDALSLDEPIGCLAFNLNEMPQGGKEPDNAADVNIKTKITNLFSVTSVRAWWLLKGNVENQMDNNVGAIKMEFTLSPKQQTLVMPVGMPQSPSFQYTRLRFQRNSLPSHFNFKDFFYKHHALWGSLTGISFVILTVIVIIYLIFFMI